MKKIVFFIIAITFGIVTMAQQMTVTPATGVPAEARQHGRSGELTIGTLTNAVPGNISVPVHAAQIVNMASFQFTVVYDPAVMTFTSVSNWYTGITSVTVVELDPGHICFLWAADVAGTNIADGVFFNINFIYNSGNSAISWSDDPITREFGDWDGNIFIPVYTNGAVNGGVVSPVLTIGTINFSTPGPVVLPVYAMNIVDLGSFQFTVEYDVTKLTFTGTSGWYPGVTSVTVSEPAPGHLSFVWAASIGGVNIPDGTFFNINFTHNSGSSSVIWSDNPTYREFGDWDGIIFVPAYIDGAVNEGGPLPAISVTPANQAVSFSPGTASFAVLNTGGGTMTYSAQITEGSEWLTLSGGGSGGNSGTIEVTFLQNPNPVQRIGAITVTAPGAEGSPVLVTVTQASSSFIPVLTIGTIGVSDPGPVVLPVHATNIVNLGSFQFTIEYNPALLTFTGTSGWYAGISSVTIGTAVPGQITFIWATEAAGINIPDGTFFNLNFNYTSGISDVSWSDNPTAREFGDWDGNILDPVYHDGALTLPDTNVVAGTVTGTVCYNAIKTIRVAGNETAFNVLSGGSVTMIAGENIQYFPGTSVVEGGYLHGFITIDSSYCGTQKYSMVKNTAGSTTEILYPNPETSFFKTYPNPTGGRFILELKGEIPTEMVLMEVYGIWGEKMFTRVVNGERQCELSLSDKPSGVYFVRVISGSRSGTAVIVKK